MLIFNVKHPVKDLQLIISICCSLVKRNIEHIDHTDFYNLQHYCIKLRNKKEAFQIRTIRRNSEVLVKMNINELQSLEKIYDLNVEYFHQDKNVYERILITQILDAYFKFKINHIYAPFNYLPGTNH